MSNGAAPLSAGVRAQLREALPNCFMNDTYGASESGAAATRLDDGVSRTSPKFDIGADLMVVDEDLRPCPVGVPGMLARSGPIPLGYLGDPEKTAATFREIDGKRWSIPGDMAVINEDGALVCSAAGRRPSTRAARRSTPRRSRASCSTTRTSSTPAWSARRTNGGASRSRRWCSCARGRA